VLLWLLLGGAAVTGWYLYLSSDSAGQQTVAMSEPTREAVSPPLNITITIVDGRAEPSPAAPASPAVSAVVAAPAPAPAPAAAPAAAASGLVVVAYDGSIVFVGDDGVLTANTGAVSSSGTLAIDSQGSTLSSGNSAAPVLSLGGSATQGPLAGNLGGRPVSIAGFEDHSINVLGNDQIVTYDDSNVFLDRTGQINANTGDTDSSGLNAVDVTGSSVRSGDSGDDEDDSEEGEEDEEEEDLATLSSTASSADDDATTSASGHNPLVIGGDGYDDLAVRSAGNRNIITYDDSNVVIGGTGGVNAQIGDSDTGGAVVMGIHDSQVVAGNAF
jgi:hypothetical protein